MDSVHLPFSEHDLTASCYSFTMSGFNSRAPRGARLTCESLSHRPHQVSIHVPLAEHDNRGRLRGLRDVRFNSRAPRGARLPNEKFLLAPRMFQFTCPSRSTTRPRSTGWRTPSVSIHVPLAEHDLPSGRPQDRLRRFNSRAPRGARRRDLPEHRGPSQFQFTCPSRSTTHSPLIQP